MVVATDLDVDMVGPQPSIDDLYDVDLSVSEEKPPRPLPGSAGVMTFHANIELRYVHSVGAISLSKAQPISMPKSHGKPYAPAPYSDRFVGTSSRDAAFGGHVACHFLPAPLRSPTE